MVLPARHQFDACNANHKRAVVFMQRHEFAIRGPGLIPQESSFHGITVSIREPPQDSGLLSLVFHSHPAVIFPKNRWHQRQPAEFRRPSQGFETLGLGRPKEQSEPRCTVWPSRRQLPTF